MMRPDANVAVFVCVTPVDMRKQAATLALIVEQTLKRNIFEPGLYVFSNERRDRIKIVYWHRNGLCLWSKRLEGRDRFLFPRQIEGETVTIWGEINDDQDSLYRRAATGLDRCASPIARRSSAPASARAA